jgi:hypothetical protein
LPGVSVQGITSTGGFDASTAVTGLYGQWDHLTPAQRDAANRYLATSHTQAQWSTAPTAPSASAVLLGSINTPAFDYQALADDANHDEALNTGTALVELQNPTRALLRRPRPVVAEEVVVAAVMSRNLRPPGNRRGIPTS